MMEKDGVSISEEDVSVILQRYSPTTILDLLQEIAQVQDVRIDWNVLVKHTKTGITNPRECQMLWRHLAYCDPFLEKLENDAEPLDDDSDLECELEAFPSVSYEDSAEALACVKVLMVSNSPSESCIEKGLIIEAPLTINMPKTISTQNPQFSSVNICVPVYVQTQTLPTVSSAEGLDNVNMGPNSNYPPRRKRKPWTAAEDRELFAAVQKYGEGNWANIVKGDFKGERTASQLSQRWSNIKKRQNQPSVKTSFQPSEAQLAARRAITMALDKPRADIPKTTSSLGMPSLGIMAPQNYDSTPTGPPSPFPRHQPFPTRPLSSGPDAVKAAAVAAGARIATQSAAAAILLKQQSKSAIHIKTASLPTGPRPNVFHSPFSRHSSNGTHGNLGSSHVNQAGVKVGPVVKPSGSAKTEPEPVQENQGAENLAQKINDPDS